MTKYNVVMCYSLALTKEVIAKDEDTAISKAEQWAESLSDEKFTELGEPQHTESYIT